MRKPPLFKQASMEFWNHKDIETSNFSRFTFTKEDCERRENMFFIRMWFLLKTFFIILLWPSSIDKTTTRKRLLTLLVGANVEVLTTFGYVSGRVVSVKKDYVVLMDSLDTEIFVRIAKVESIRT
jgi:hypothetical protein